MVSGVFLRSDDYALFRVNPIQYAAQKGISEAEAVDQFMFAVKAGLFEVEWYLVCSSDRKITRCSASIRSSTPHKKGSARLKRLICSCLPSKRACSRWNGIWCVP